MKKLLIVMMVLFVCAAVSYGVKLKFLWYVDATQANYPADKAMWDKFKAENPDIELDQEILFNEPFHQKVSAGIAAGTLSDVMYAWPSGRSMPLHEGKLIKDLTPLLGKDYLKDFVPAAIDPNNQGAKFLGVLPQSVTYTTVMYANKALIEANGLKVPTTYAQLKAMVPKLKAKGIAIVLMANKDTWPMQSCLFSTVSGRLLGDAFIDNVKAGKAKFTDAAFVNALKFIETMYKDGVISKDTIQIGYGESPALFAAGKAAFLIDGDWRIGDMITDKASGKPALIAPEKQKSDFVFLPFVQIPGEKNKGTVSAVVGVGLAIAASVPAGSDVEKAAVRLLKYYYGPENSKLRLESGAFIPSRKGVTSDKLDPFSAMMPLYYASIPATTYVLDGALDPSVFNVLNTGLQEIGLGTKTPAVVAKEMQTAMDALLAKK
jgi:raffinose/stachyose/melibiose transport system substrate-binding protein